MDAQSQSAGDANYVAFLDGTNAIYTLTSVARLNAASTYGGTDVFVVGDSAGPAWRCVCATVSGGGLAPDTYVCSTCATDLPSELDGLTSMARVGSSTTVVFTKGTYEVGVCEVTGTGSATTVTCGTPATYTDTAVFSSAT